MQIHGTRTLVTGASGGIGHAIARALSAAGADLVLTSRRTELLAELADELGAEVIPADLSNRDDVDRLIAMLTSGPRVDILVANAGLPGSGALIDFTQDEIDQCLEVNLRAPIALARALAPAMVAHRAGHLSFVSSLSGVAASVSTSVYSATKFGLRGFAHGLRQDLHGTGVGVSVVLPGFVSDAGMFADTGVSLPAGARAKTAKQVADAVLKTIVKNKAEIVVAPPEMHAGALFAAVAPGVAGAVSRRLPAAQVATSMAAARRNLP